jgi:hypothetical protein
MTLLAASDKVSRGYFGVGTCGFDENFFFDFARVDEEIANEPMVGFDDA